MRPHRVPVFLLCAGLLTSGCTEDRHHDADNPRVADGPQGLSPCGPGRKVRLGVRLDEEHQCLLDAEPAGCVEDAECLDDFATYARDALGRPWRFGSTCIADGFTAVGSNQGWDAWDWCSPPSEEEPYSCPGRDPTSCAGSSSCTNIIGIPYEPERRCRYRAREVGCRAKADSCKEGRRFARSQFGDHIQLMDSCIPIKHELVTAPAPTVEDWPECDPTSTPK